MRKVLGVLLLCVAVDVHAATPCQQCPDAKENPLPLPSYALPVNSTIKQESLAAYEKQIFDFLDSAQYEVKVQFEPPAARYDTKPPDSLKKDWTIMIKDSSGSHDGWFWGEFYTGMTFDDHEYPFNYPTASFGLYCLRCHASAARELTFASLANIKGFPGVPLTFRVDDSWRTPAASARFAHTQFVGHAPAEQEAPALPPVEEVNEQFLRTFPQLAPIPTHAVQHIPNETWDLTPPPKGTKVNPS